MKPSIIVVGLDKDFVHDVVQGLTEKEPTISNEPIDWTIDTKYYTADVQICPVTSKILVEQSVAESSEVLILLADPNEINTQAKLDSWLPFFSVLNEHQMKLLVTRRVDALTNSISLSALNEWCTENDYELLELEKKATSENEDVDDDDDCDQFCPDVYGIPRLRQTLELHQWSNMNLKDRREINRNLAAQLKAKLNFDETETFDHVKVDEEQNEENDSSRTTSNHHDSDPFDMENIFEQMRRYKEEADRLTGDERKLFAEKVVLQLWKSVADEDAAEDDDELEN